MYQEILCWRELRHAVLKSSLMCNRPKNKHVIDSLTMKTAMNEPNRDLLVFQNPYSRSCDLSESPTVILQLNESSNSYQVLGNLTRRLRPYNDSFVEARECDCIPEHYTDSNSYYCPTATRLCLVRLPHSGRPDIGIECYNETQQAFLRYIFPLGLFLFIFLGILIFCSPKGNYARFYARKLLYCWSEDRYREELNKELGAMRMREYARRQAARSVHERSQGQRVYIPSHAPSLESFLGQRRDLTAQGAAPTVPPPLRLSTPEEVRPASGRIREPSSARNRQANRARRQQHQQSGLATASMPETLARAASMLGQLPAASIVAVEREPERLSVRLKTRRYQATEDDPDAICSICLSELEPAARIGDLECGHVFHVDCLRRWIQRSNHCPLCKSTKVTTPHTSIKE